MINAIRTYTNHTVIGIIVEGVPSLVSSIKAVVHKVALSTLINVVISIPLFYLQHNLFVMGFIVGFVFDKQVRQLVEKVNTVFQTQRSYLENTVIFVGGSFVALLALPTSMVVATLFYSSQWGAALYHNSFARNNKEEAKHDPEDPMELVQDPIDEEIEQDTPVVNRGEQDPKDNAMKVDAEVEKREEVDLEAAEDNGPVQKKVKIDNAEDSETIAATTKE